MYFYIVYRYNVYVYLHVLILDLRIFIYIYICQAYCLAKIKMFKSRTFVLDCILVVKSLSKCHIFMLLILISGTKMWYTLCKFLCLPLGPILVLVFIIYTNIFLYINVLKLNILLIMTYL